MIVNKKVISFFIFCIFLSIFIFANNAFAEEVSVNSVLDIVEKIKESTDIWYERLLSFATQLFALILLFEFLWTGTKAVIQEMSLQDILRNIVWILLAGIFFLAIINNYQEWTQAIVNGLSNKATSLIGSGYRDDNPFLIGIKIYEIIEEAIEQASFLVGMMMYLCSGIIMIIFAIITARVIVVKCEVLIGLTAAILLIPFGASQMFREFAINAMKYVLSVGFKLFTITLICGITFEIFVNFKFTETGLLKNSFILIGVSIVILTIISTLPETIASLISSAHGGSGAGLLQSVNTLSNIVTAGAAGAIALGKMAGAPIKATHQAIRAKNIAKESAGAAWNSMGKIGKTVAGFKAWNGARQQANMNRSTIGQELKNNYNQLKALRNINRGG